MRIVQVITIGDRMYGAQKHVLDLATEFTKDGHEVLVVTGSVGALDVLCRERGISTRQIPSLQRPIRLFTDMKACGEFKSVLKEFKPDIVASHSSKAGIVSRFVCYRMGIPNTFTAHGWTFEDGVPGLRRLAYKWIEKAAGRVSHKIITVSHLGRELALQHRIVPEKKLAMIYYGTPDTGGELKPVKQDTFTMSMVAGFREQKDHTTLIHALSGLKDRAWQINLLGDGPLQPEIEELVDNYGLSDRVHFKGMVDNVPEYLSKTDLLVLITNWEGLPISTLEGMTFGLPAVSSNVSGVKEQVVDGYNGITVNRGDVEDVRRALAEMIDQPEKVRQYGENSRQLYLDKFTDEVMYGNTKKLYESMILESVDSSRDRRLLGSLLKFSRKTVATDNVQK